MTKPRRVSQRRWVRRQDGGSECSGVERWTPSELADFCVASVRFEQVCVPSYLIAGLRFPCTCATLDARTTGRRGFCTRITACTWRSALREYPLFLCNSSSSLTPRSPSRSFGTGKPSRKRGSLPLTLSHPRPVLSGPQGTQVISSRHKNARDCRTVDGVSPAAESAACFTAYGLRWHLSS